MRWDSDTPANRGSRLSALNLKKDSRWPLERGKASVTTAYAGGSMGDCPLLVFDPGDDGAVDGGRLRGIVLISPSLISRGGASFFVRLSPQRAPKKK
jgi:hypothetical protein